MPGQAYNPLFICGPPGLGKTHLLHAIANYVTRFGGGLTVALHDGRGVHRRVRRARSSAAARGLQGRLPPQRRPARRRRPVPQSKARTEEEFFHTFNALHEAGSQLVLTSDRMPRDIDGARGAAARALRGRPGRATSGPPDRATRLTILRKRVAHDGIGDVDPAALELIADRVTANVRALEGALIRVVAYASLTGRPIDARSPTRSSPASTPRPGGSGTPSRDVQAATCEAFDLAQDELVSGEAAPRASRGRDRSRCTCPVS